MLEPWMREALQLADEYSAAGFESASEAVRETLRIYVRGKNDG